MYVCMYVSRWVIMYVKMHSKIAVLKLNLYFKILCFWLVIFSDYNKWMADVLGSTIKDQPVFHQNLWNTLIKVKSESI